MTRRRAIRGDAAIAIDAVARLHAVPLLFKGDDFVHTDIEPAHAIPSATPR